MNTWKALGVLYFSIGALGAIVQTPQHLFAPENVGNENRSLNISKCPGTSDHMNIPISTKECVAGYSLNSLQESDIGLTARLSLFGPACNAFGMDVSSLTVQVTYESDSR